MSKPSEVALAARKKLKDKEGPSATFPPDKIWAFASDPPDSERRPGAIN